MKLLLRSFAIIREIYIPNNKCTLYNLCTNNKCILMTLVIKIALCIVYLPMNNILLININSSHSMAFTIALRGKFTDTRIACHAIN